MDIDVTDSGDANIIRHPVIKDEAVERLGTSRRDGGNRSFQRTVDVLDALAASAEDGVGSVTLTSLAQDTGLPKSTVHRLLKGLAEVDFVAATPEGQYRLGRGLMRLGSLARLTNRSFDSAVSSLRRLAAFTGDAVFYSERRGTIVDCMWREDGTGPFRNNVLAVGDRYPLGVGGGSLAILAAMPEDEAEEAMEANLRVFPEDTSVGQVLRSELLTKELAEARENGFAVNTGLVFEESWAVAVAIPGSCVNGGGASLSVASVRSRLQGTRLAQVVAALRQEARMLAKAGQSADRSSQTSGGGIPR